MQNRKSVQLPPHCRTRSSVPKAAQSAALQDAGAQVLGRVHHRGAFQERNELRRFWSAPLCGAVGRKSSVERFDLFREPPVVRFQKRRKAPHSKTLARWSSGGFIIGALSRNRTNSEGFGVRRCAALLGAKVASSGLISFASRPSSGSKSGAKRRTPRRWRAGPGAGSSSGRFPGIERTPKVLECAAVRRFWAKDGRMICYSRARQTVRVTCRRSAGGGSARRLETLVRGTERKACAAVGCRRLIRPMKFHPVSPQTT